MEFRGCKFGQKGYQRSKSTVILFQNVFYKVHKVCVAFHAFIKHCIIHSLSLSMLLY